ncbi:MULTISPECIES: bifunctional [glutamine synthetase] adenylyltransferase/[glutamine synthetase]-adenylyl-L-tyrosine phosphorylase [unclassified Rathayibacter]|uniref:bifunctional [glutamine synthetase] adenylyltransferase/[glutamine synthetase]-adenylyl-L-tyrosine phosphorylase n=1 Tax=unclassified Rathayibacter TaxID=2609250 RepID=UPI00188AD95F|nr:MULTISPECIES: bifunctional [glutamine synthetase] adenylyltransferase/[glutamine synthetase]-adenylyl-L-tyrosine phosphorylase [unclassified Rathayibacter]MBF4462286.1 bifunctional [glutamine synthetase] adenylyltransferase/[glutamine synthetase]-adenylyl-L-tyrosine phosphorylase [Rathayibacter sp. VKM Ac-2879]MBF4503671.1 bifunctional [glutamine synthetase] adenylyltransferase/[glutamine synthetase]-adenylyl-L-tyrosine phosphorylase [Rathayibacter sp. VKM Ac-2878]
MPRERSLSDVARLGFVALGDAGARLAEAEALAGRSLDSVVPAFARVADPDAALGALIDLLRRHRDRMDVVLVDDPALTRLLLVLGASSGLADFLQRRPDELEIFRDPLLTLPGRAEARTELLDSVGAVDGVASVREEAGWTALRVRYRRLLTRIVVHDLSQADPVSAIDRVTRALADLAGATLEASLAVARADLIGGVGPGRFGRDEVEATRFAIIGMGKAGASELNYVSDVDVIFVAEGDPERGLSNARAVDIGTRLAVLVMRGTSALALEPELWEVDPNLRPEGKQGALVRTLESHVTYYDRWAKSWEFQALLKARPLAGDPDLGRAYVDAVAPKVWSSASRENFVESVQRMRERVTENIPPHDVHYQLKLGPGGLRDIEFTVQLLQLVHGQNDDEIHMPGTLLALGALAERGYIGRAEAEQFAQDYRALRLLEHRLQLRRLRRTHLMPRDEHELRTLARSSTLARTADELLVVWNEIKHRVRGLHERLFYRPLLSAVAALPEGGAELSAGQAEARLAAIGFADARGALGHIAAMTSGVSRRASIQRHLVPVMLQWFADGADPDYGLLAFRRLSDALGGTPWFLRMLRDSSGAAKRLTTVLAGSRFVGELLDRIPESAAWLEDDDALRPRDAEALAEEVRAVLARHESPEAVAAVLRAMRRREVLRTAMGGVLGLSTIEEIACSLTDIITALVNGVLDAVRRSSSDRPGVELEFAVIGMGRYGGSELGFGSDADVMYVQRPGSAEPQQAQQYAQFLVGELVRLTEDSRLPLDLDAELRPEGKNGPLVRSLESYRAYYARWSLTWEAQALLRARGVAGDAALIADFERLADSVRYPSAISDRDIREVKRIKARVENERLPQGADPRRHLKLGRGSLSDVEWLVQLLQLQHARSLPALRTTSTLTALRVAEEASLVSPLDAERLRAAWLLASRVRSAMTLWTNRTSDVLPTDRRQLEGVARLLEYPAGSATALEDDYLGVTRRARAVFERLFYGPADADQHTRR